MATQGYKKYMKKDAVKEYPLVKMFALTFFGMLIIFTFLIKSFSPSVDVSIGDYKHDNEVETEDQSAVDGRLAMIQDEDRGRSFSDLMKKAEDEDRTTETLESKTDVATADKPKDDVSEAVKVPVADPIYKVYIGSYTSAEQAKVAKDIIQETGSNLNPIVKCIGSNNYTLQVGSFKNKSSAEALLSTVQQNHLPGRISQEY